MPYYFLVRGGGRGFNFTMKGIFNMWLCVLALLCCTFLFLFFNKLLCVSCFNYRFPLPIFFMNFRYPRNLF